MPGLVLKVGPWRAHHGPLRKSEDMPDGDTVPGLDDISVSLLTNVSLLRALVLRDELSKALTAGSYDAAPSTLTGGASLQREDISNGVRKKAITTMCNYAERPFQKSRFKEFAKSQMPDVSDEFLNHFANLAEEYHLQKSDDSPTFEDDSPVLGLYDRLVQLRKAAVEVMEPEAPPGPTVHRVDVSGRRLGRYVEFNGHITHLEDYYGQMSNIIPEGPSAVTSGLMDHGIQAGPVSTTLDAPSYFPPKPELPPNEVSHVITPDPVPARAPIFEYFRPGMDKPHKIEFTDNGGALDGKALEDDELSFILNNIANGVGTCSYVKTPPAACGLTPGECSDIGCLDHGDADLQKADTEHMDPDTLMAHIRAAEKAGHLPAGSSEAGVKHMFHDPMVPGMGNKAAWVSFKNKNKPGVYVALDGNDFKHINTEHGHDGGDAAISAIGEAAKEASKQTGAGKLFRSGGDEFIAHFPTSEHAHQFARHMSEHLDRVPPIGGTHKLSVSMGLGHDFHHADRALEEAKKQKVDTKTGARAFAPGKVPNLVHSNIIGSEGPVPPHQEHV